VKYEERKKKCVENIRGLMKIKGKGKIWLLEFFTQSQRISDATDEVIF
jgi:hypothetical protein